MKVKEYIVYNTKNDDVLAVGDAEECARQLGLKSKDVFYTYKSKQKLKIKKGVKSRYMVYEIEEGEEDESDYM